MRSVAAFVNATFSSSPSISAVTVRCLSFSRQVVQHQSDRGPFATCEVCSQLVSMLLKSLLQLPHRVALVLRLVIEFPELVVDVGPVSHCSCRLLYEGQFVGHRCTLVYPRLLACVLELLQLRRLQLDLAVDASRQSLVLKLLERGHERLQMAKHFFQMRSPLRACVRRRSRSGCTYHARRLCCLSCRMPEMTTPKTHERTSIPSSANLRI